MRFVAIALLCLVPITAHAKQSPYPPVTQYDGDRVAARQAQMGADVIKAVRRERASKRHHRRQRAPVVRRIGLAGGMGREAIRVIGGRPTGCPHAFCGCGASLHLFGRIIPSLNLAANWLRFPRTAPAPKMAAARRGHVFVLERHIRGLVWLVFDANSGGHRTRIHPRSIAGFRIVNPHRSSS